MFNTQLVNNHYYLGIKIEESRIQHFQTIQYQCVSYVSISAQDMQFYMHIVVRTLNIER